MRAEPFSLSSEGNFSPGDPRTRITLFCMNLDFLAGETVNSLTADAEDAGHVHYPLQVEYVGQVPPLVDSQGNVTSEFRGIYMVVLRLNDLMTGNLGDVLIRFSLHGMSSNRVRVAIGQISLRCDRDLIRLDIQVPDAVGILLDELPARLHLVPHEHREHLLRFHQVLELYL